MALNLKEPHIINATYRIVTPMFIGDAEQKASGISPTSVKGALRFWWRALNWGRVYVGKKGDEKEALKALHEEEVWLFGTSAENGRAASFTLRLDTSNISITHSTDWPNGGNDPSGYLGMGLWESGSHEKGNFQPHREYIKEDRVFTVTLICSHAVSESRTKQLEEALKAWGLFGGLGSRARRAYGSVAIESINGDDVSYKFDTPEQYTVFASGMLSKYCFLGVVNPPFTALSDESSFGVSTQLRPNARSAHAGLGQAFKDYRGQPSGLRGSKKRVFGMPYSGGTPLEANARRASPLLFHIHPVAKQFISAALFLPAEFHHESALEHVDYSLAKGFVTTLETGAA